MTDVTDVDDVFNNPDDSFDGFFVCRSSRVVLGIVVQHTVELCTCTEDVNIVVRSRVSSAIHIKLETWFDEP